MPETYQGERDIESFRASDPDVYVMVKAAYAEMHAVTALIEEHGYVEPDRAAACFAQMELGRAAMGILEARYIARLPWWRRWWVRRRG